MTVKKILFSLSLGVSLLTTSLLADDAKARGIMEKVDAREDGKTLERDTQMILIDKRGNKRVRNMKSYSKDYGKDEKKVIFFKSPADVKNTGFLTFDYDTANKDDDQWLYLPALKKVKRIPSSDKSASFMGSDYSYFDMTKTSLNDYNFKFMKDTTVRGHPAWMIESTPRTKKIKKESGYSKSINIVRKDNYVVVRSIAFMRGGKKKYLDVTGMHKQGGIWITDEMSMTTKKGKNTLHKTILKYSNTKLNTSINDNMFTKRRLEKGL
jgi:outer membrane lipoprotein-sorting protein